MTLNQNATTTTRRPVTPSPPRISALPLRSRLGTRSARTGSPSRDAPAQAQKGSPGMPAYRLAESSTLANSACRDDRLKHRSECWDPRSRPTRGGPNGQRRTFGRERSSRHAATTPNKTFTSFGIRTDLVSTRLAITSSRSPYGLKAGMTQCPDALLNGPLGII